jgi:hypothetical protein
LLRLLGVTEIFMAGESVSKVPWSAGDATFTDTGKEGQTTISISATYALVQPADFGAVTRDWKERLMKTSRPAMDRLPSALKSRLTENVDAILTRTAELAPAP